MYHNKQNWYSIDNDLTLHTGFIQTLCVILQAFFNSFLTFNNSCKIKNWLTYHANEIGLIQKIQQLVPDKLI